MRQRSARRGCAGLGEESPADLGEVVSGLPQLIVASLSIVQVKAGVCWNCYVLAVWAVGAYADRPYSESPNQVSRSGPPLAADAAVARHDLWGKAGDGSNLQMTSTWNARHPVRRVGGWREPY